MKNIFGTGLAVAAVFASVAVAQSTADLPSAPSAVQQQQNAPAQVQQPPAPAQPQAQPAAQSAPATPPAQAVQPAAQPAASPAEGDPKPAATASNTAPPTSNSNIPSKQDDAGYTVETIKKRVDEVNVIFTVTDKHGHFIKNLTKEDFTVLDDHKPPASVVSFRAETDLPLRVGLLIDASNSIRDRFKFEQEASIEFLNQTVRPGRDKAFVIGFDTTAEVTADYTDNSEKLAKGIRVLRPGGGTALFDALYYACRDKLGNLQEKSPVRRAIVLISDGEDNQSRVTREEAIEMAQRAEVIIYAISTNVSNMKLRGDKILERLAEATGGRVYFPMKIEEVADYFNQIQEELRSQYAVAYKPANFLPDGRFRPIEIMAQNHKGLKVRARQGYYAPTQ